MTLRRDDADFAGRIMRIKQGLSRPVPSGERINASRVRRGESGLWQRRHWEHLIRDEIDFERQVDTRHFNPVKHGWVAQAVDWPHSSIHRYLRQARTLEFTMFTPTYRADLISWRHLEARTP